MIVLKRNDCCKKKPYFPFFCKSHFEQVSQWNAKFKNSVFWSFPSDRRTGGHFAEARTAVERRNWDRPHIQECRRDYQRQAHRRESREYVLLMIYISYFQPWEPWECVAYDIYILYLGYHIRLCFPHMLFLAFSSSSMDSSLFIWHFPHCPLATNRNQKARQRRCAHQGDLGYGKRALVSQATRCHNGIFFI